MGDENNNGISDGNQKQIDPDANTKIYEPARSVGNSLVDAASSVGNSLKGTFGGSDPSLGNQINDNLQTLAKKKAPQRLQGQNN